MKKIILLMTITVNICLSQTDTLYTLNRQKIPCKIYELSDTEIKYRVSYEDGPLIVTDKSNFYKFVLSNGYSEIMVADELSIENNPADILNQNRVIKIHPFSFANNHLSFAYEKVMKRGTHLDLEAGYINSSITQQALFGDNLNQKAFNTGAYIKPGIKFMSRPNYVTKGMRMTHPLKGGYIKLDVAMSLINFKDVKRTIYSSYGTTPTPTVIASDITTFSYGGFVNFGYQTVLGDMLTMDWYCGFGFTGQSNTFSNSAFNTMIYNYRDVDASRIYNYHSYLRVPYVGLSFTGGFRIGYILADPVKKKK
jgi:hypothetical protein